MRKSLLFIVICAAFILDTVLGFGAAGAAMLAQAIPGGMYNPDVFHFRENLEKKVGKEVWYKGKIGAMASFIDYDKFKKTGAFGSVPGSLAPTEAIIYMVRDFKSKKGVKIEIPLLRPLTGQGVTGTDTLKNKGESRKIFSTKCAINMRRHAVLVRDNEMSEQMLDPEIAIAMLEGGASDLKDWFSRLMPFDMYFALLTGYSTNLTNASWGLGYTQRSHPNSYVQGSGQVAFKTSSGAHVAYTFDAGYEVNYATALATLTAVAGDYFTTQSIRNMVYLARKHKIEPIKKGGQELYPIFIHDAQARQLREDTVWQQVMREAWERGQKNPLFTGAVEGYIYEGAFLVVDSTLPAARVTGDTGYVDAESSNGLSTGVHYIKSNFLDDPRDQSVRKCALLVGAGGINAAEGLPFKFTEETDDHGQKIEHGGRMIFGFSRPDIIDDDNYMGNGAGLFYDNLSSLTYWTYSPDAISV